MFATRPFRAVTAAGIAARSLGRPAAAFPGRVATDADLMIAGDRQQTRLALPLNASDTSMTVVDATAIGANNLLTIDAEIVRTTGAPTGNVVPISRGFDGTTPVVHLASAVVSGFVDAWHHNALTAEVEAIEQALGPNLSAIPASPWLISKTYDFAAQTPGGSLVVGANSITLTPVPAGINGSNTGHSLYISGGTGTAEAALIIGGSAVSGAATGTVIVQCANTHSGAWMIKSATAGIMEALYAAGQVGNVAQGSILIPAGTHTIYGTIVLRNNGLALRGMATLATTLTTTMTNAPLISIPANASQITISDLTLMGPNTGTNFACSFYNQANLVFARVSIFQFGQGLSFTGRDITQNNHISDVFIGGVVGDGIYIDSGPAAGGYFDNILISGTTATSTGFRIVNGVGGYINAFYTNGVAFGIIIAPVTGNKVGVLDIVSGTCDGFGPNSNVGILIQPSGGEVSIVRITDCNAAGFIFGLWCKQAGAGTYIADITLTNCGAVGNSGGGFQFEFGTNIILQNCTAQGNGTSGTPAPGVTAGGNPTLNGLRIDGGWYAAGSYAHEVSGGNSQNVGILINGATANVRVSNLVATPNISAGVFIAGVNPGLVIENVRGYNPVGPAGIVVGASPFTYTAGSSRETVYIFGGTVSNVSLGGTQIAAASPTQVQLAPGEAMTVTYSVAPSMVKDVH